MRRRILLEEGLCRDLVVLGVKLVAIVLVLWLCLQILPDEAREIATHLLGYRPAP